MTLELAKVTDISERFYGTMLTMPANDRQYNADGTIAYQAVEGFTSTLRDFQLAQDEEQPENEDTLPEERDIDSRVYTNKVSQSLITKILIEKYQRRKNVKEIYFSIKNFRQQASVHASIKDGIMYCTISSARDDLRKELNLGVRAMKLAIREETRLNLYVSVTDEILFGRV